MGNEHLAAEAVASKVLGLAAEIADQGKTVSAESVLRDLGFDDLSAIELVTSIEDDLEIDIDVSEYDNAPEAFLSLTLQALIDAALKAVAKSPAAALPSARISDKELEKVVGHRVHLGKGSLVVEQPVTEQAPKLTPADIEAVIVSEHYFTAGQGDRAAVEDAAFSGGAFHASASRHTPHELDLVTVCVLLLRNGAKVTGVNHGPVSAANFDPAKGREYARAAAIEKVWELEGYALRERLSAPASVVLDFTPDQEAALHEQLRNAPPGTLEPGTLEPAGGQTEKSVEDMLAIFPPHERRVIEEYCELVGRRNRLIDFLGSMKFQGLPAEDQDLLKRQLDVMNDYAKILVKRCDRFEVPAGLVCPGLVPVDNATDGGPNPHYDPDADKGAKLLAIMRAFVDLYRVSCPETIHQTDRVIEKAGGLVEKLCDVAGYYRDPDDEAEEAQP